MLAISDAHLSEYYEPLQETMEKYEINTPLRVAHFLAQCGHESLDMVYMEELASGSDYEGRKDLGNIVIGDGKKFKGRGMIQLTGRGVYEKYQKYIAQNPTVFFHDFDENPNLLSVLPYCIDSAGWFWSIYKNINKEADQDKLIAVTKLVNGGLTGFTDRKKRLIVAKKVLGVGISPALT